MGAMLRKVVFPVFFALPGLVAAGCASHSRLVPPPAVMSEAIQPAGTEPPEGVLSGAEPVWKAGGTQPVQVAAPAVKPAKRATPVAKASSQPVRTVAAADSNGFRKKYVYASHAAEEEPRPAAVSPTTAGGGSSGTRLVLTRTQPAAVIPADTTAVAAAAPDSTAASSAAARSTPQASTSAPPVTSAPAIPATSGTSPPAAAPPQSSPPPAQTPPAPTPDNGPLPRYGDPVKVDEMPEPITRVVPSYPQVARDKKIEGIVLLQVLVDRKGMVRDMRLVKSIPELDGAAKDAVRQWTFEPGRYQGQPVAVWIPIPVKFSMH